MYLKHDLRQTILWGSDTKELKKTLGRLLSVYDSGPDVEQEKQKWNQYATIMTGTAKEGDDEYWPN
jgi:hypothetical protein